jgi:hypothetical protein
MARTITLELTDEQEQKLVLLAQQLNLPIESVLLRSLQKNLDTPPQPQPPDSITQLFEHLHHAIQTQQAIAIAPADELTTQIAQRLKSSQTILDFQIINQQLVLSVNPNPPKPSFAVSSPEDLSQLPPALTEIAQRLHHEDPNTRLQAVDDLAGWYREQP